MKISIRQTCFLVVLMMLAMRVIIEPSVMFYASGRDAWISYAVALIIQVVGIYFIVSLIKANPGKNFVEVSEKYVGAFLTKVLLVLLSFYFIFKIITTDYEMQNYSLEAIYTDLNWNIFIIPIFLVMLYIAIKGPNVMGRISQIFVAFSLVVLIYTLIVALSGAKVMNLLPMFTESFSRISKGVLYGVAQMGEFLFLFMFMENISFTNPKQLNAITRVSIVVSLGIVAFYFLFVAVFGDIAISLQEGIIRITQFNMSETSNLRLDGITTVLWTPINVIMCGVCFYCAGKSLMHLFGKNQFKNFILIVFVIVVFSKLLPFIQSTIVIGFNLKYLSYVWLAVEILIPLILFIASKIKKEKYEKTA